MSSQTRVNITSPVGRLVMGSLYTGYTTDAENKPLVYKNGPDAGKPRLNFSSRSPSPKPASHIGLIPNGGERFSKLEPKHFPRRIKLRPSLGRSRMGIRSFPRRRRAFPIRTKVGKEIGSSSFQAPSLRKSIVKKARLISKRRELNLAFFVQVAFSVDGNQSTSQPGVYLNHSMVCLRGFGPEIVIGPNVEDAGFGAAPLPAGASLTPPCRGRSCCRRSCGSPFFAGRDRRASGDSIQHSTESGLLAGSGCPICAKCGSVRTPSECIFAGCVCCSRCAGSCDDCIPF